MKNTICIITFLLLVNVAFGQQEFYGKWYLFSRNRVIELTLTPDSAVTTQYSFKLVPREGMRNFRDAHGIKYLKPVNGRTYVSLTSTKDEGNPMISYLEFQKGQVIMNAVDTAVTDSAIIHQIMQTDTTTRVGLNFFSEQEKDRFLKLPPVSSMTKADYKRYAVLINDLKSKLKRMEKPGDDGYLLLFYAYSQYRLLLAETGFNPFTDTAEFEAMVKKFEKDPETKGLIIMEE